ncbi:uncharacterized protein HMPREF1541_06601 [Cyphellophora europaea CBS 101466]|uniref:Transcription elongation factor SPT5 n=1 Tax=Cyphellophora europaea (strain CBS 101466) TaxID=1220924 RepID=W2RS73_CYPE1|nr:uncharacterized protein HMPREF1541_06601 [Cyphellophora europaea CBS 101466]ETN38564.1 hypothetical protein HMPREF1541_06601 [Cyphellophora europaea CBS 101466]
MSANLLNQNFDEDEESDNDFNPGVEQGSDAGGDNDDNKSNNVNGDSSPAPRRRTSDAAEDEDEKPADNGEDDEGEGEDLGGEDEDDEDEEEDEEEDGIRSRPRKRRRGLNQFFEEEAEVDEDDDELEADEEGLGNEFIEDTHPDDDLPAEADQDDRRHRELDRKRQLEASMDAEKQAAEFRERYGRRTTTAISNRGFVPQNLLMPDVSDPSIFGVKCREGKEKEIVRAINAKFIQRRARDPMRIFSAFERGDGAMKGYIFVEARNKADVEHALKDVHDVYPHSKMNLVPMKEMPDLLRVTKTKELQPGAYVRIRKGIYTGDLAVVEDTVPNGLDVTVKVVPRLTYGFDEDQPKPQAPAGSDKRKRPGFAPAQNLANRPPARLFSEVEAKKRHSRFLQQSGGLTRKSFTYKGEEYEDGFLIKTYKLPQLQTENVQPKLEETQLFTKTGQDGSEMLDLETLKQSLHDKSTAESSYQVGDEVEVFNGEQKGVVGRTERVTGNIVSIRVSEGELNNQLVEVPVRNLRKRFRDGDNVVVGGASKYRDQVGTVIAIENDKVTILSHDNQIEFTVFSKDLRIASGASASTERSPFEVRDLVQLTATTFGCVVGADPQTVKVMDQNGSIETRLPSSLSKIMVSRNAVAVDKNGSEIRQGDTIKEVGGEGKSGNILHIYRNYLFAHDRSRMVENAGIWVARSSNVVGRSARSGAPLTDLSKMNPALMQGKGPNGAPMGPPQRPGMDRLIRKKVKITKGPYKGHRGTVKDTTINEARIELESKNKTVNISKSEISVIDPNTDQATPYAQWAGRRGGPPSEMRAGPGIPGSRVPDGARTPFAAVDGGRTPAWAGASARTPAWGGPSSALDSGRTPSWRAGGSQTSYGGAGNTTTYGGAGNYSAGTGSRTPAWSSSAKTPYGADHGFGGGSSGSGSAFDAFASGSRTPAYGTSTTTVSRTPAWSGPSAAASAPTPAARAYDAPTPAAALNAPTPAFPADDGYTPAYSAPTPGAGFGNAGSMDAPTPGFARAANTIPLGKNRLAMDAPTPAGGPVSAPTPAAWGGGGAYDAPTPAVGGGPRYAEDDDDD